MLVATSFNIPLVSLKKNYFTNQNQKNSSFALHQKKKQSFNSIQSTKGDILVSIQGKNVIGIRRIAIERILKQYKVDQEIEIVVCRLKDPKFILNLKNTTSTNTNTSNN